MLPWKRTYRLFFATVALLGANTWALADTVSLEELKSRSPVSEAAVLPHALAENRTEAQDPRLVSQDYALAVLALSWVAKNVPKEDSAMKATSSQRLSRLIQDTKRLFIENDGAVTAQHTYGPAGPPPFYKPESRPDLRSQALMAYAMAYPHHSWDKYDPTQFPETLFRDTARLSIQTARFAFVNFADHEAGGFFRDSDKKGKHLSDQALGLLAIQPLAWLFEKHGQDGHAAKGGMTRDELTAFAVKTDDFLKSLWSEAYGIYGAQAEAKGGPNGFEHVTYDLPTLGYLLWGHGVLHGLLKESHAERAEAIAQRGRQLFSMLIVEGKTYRKEVGIPAQIHIVKGSVLEPEGNASVQNGALFEFAHALYQFDRTIKGTNASQVVNDLVVLGAKSLQSDGVLTHGHTFSDVKEQTIKLTPADAAAYITAAERAVDKIPAEHQPAVREAIQGNSRFLATLMEGRQPQ